MRSLQGRIVSWVGCSTAMLLMATGVASATPPRLSVAAQKAQFNAQQSQTIGFKTVNGVRYAVARGYALPFDDVATDGYTPRQVVLRGIPFTKTPAFSTIAGTRAFSVTPQGVISGNDSGGQAGWYFPKGANTYDGSTWAAMTGYLTGTVVVPTYGQNVNILYAPTMKGPNNGCLEYGSDYEYSNGAYQSYFYGVDWCNNGAGFKYPITQAFLNSYVRVYSNGDGHPEYQAESKLVNGYYQLYIFNVSNGSYDAFAHTYSSTPSAGYSFGGLGWSYWESHYYNVGDLCPQQSQVMATAGIRFFNGTWSYPQPENNSILYNNNNPSVPRDCFTGAQPISVNPRQPDLGWYTQNH